MVEVEWARVTPGSYAGHDPCRVARAAKGNALITTRSSVVYDQQRPGSVLIRIERLKPFANLLNKDRVLVSPVSRIPHHLFQVLLATAP